MQQQVRREPLYEDETDGGERGRQRQEELIAAHAARREEEVQHERDDDERHRDHQLLRTETGGLRSRDRDGSGDAQRGDPEEQSELGPAARQGDHPAPFSIRIAIRPIASSSPNRRRSARSMRVPLTRGPWVPPRSSIHQAPSRSSSTAWRAEAASSDSGTSFPASRPIDVDARSENRSPTRGAWPALRSTTSTPSARVAPSVVRSATSERCSTPKARSRKR